VSVAGGGLSIGQVAERTGLSAHTVRFYERAGQFAEPVQRIAGRRVFSEEHVEWLALCSILRASGMPLAAIRAYAQLVRQGDGTEPERLALFARAPRARPRPAARPLPLPRPDRPQGRRLRGPQRARRATPPLPAPNTQRGPAFSR
jgi:DNA-binding transcriptional MerR regulator